MHKKTIQLWIILLISVLCAHLDKVNAKKNSEEIIVINNTGGGGCGSGAKTIVKTDGKKKKGGHKIILMAGGGGKCGEKHHHHTRVVHVPVPVPVPVVKHEHHKDHWGGGSSHDDHWASASSTDEIKPKSIKVSSASVPHQAFGIGHMMSRMEKQSNEQKSTILQSLLNNDNKSNRLDKKSSKSSSNDSKKKNNSEKQNSETSQLTHHLIDHPPTGQKLLAPIQFNSNPMLPDTMQMNQQSALINQMHSAAFMNPSFLPPSMIPNDIAQHQQSQQLNLDQQHQLQYQQELQQEQLHNAIRQQFQMQQQFEQHLQNERQKMQEAIAASQALPLSQDSPLASQLPIPMPGQSLSAPVFEPINPINQTDQSNNLNGPKISPGQFNELEIIPYEVQQLQAAAQFARQFVHGQSIKDQLPMISSDKELQGKKKTFEHINKDHPLDVSASNTVMEAILPPPTNHQLANFHQQFLKSNSQSNDPHHLQEMIFSSHPLQQVHSFMMVDEKKLNQNHINQAQKTIQIPILIPADQPEQEEKPTIKRYRI